MRRLLPLVIVSVLLLGVVSASAATTTVTTTAPTWKSVFSDEFTSGYSTATWTRYNGVPRCCAATRWDPSHLVVSQGIMNLQNYRDSALGGKWVSAGLSMGKSLDQTYGKWSVRFRMDRAMGVGMCFALWPKTGWPPEIDFAEESAKYGDRTVETGTLHYGSANSQIHSKVTGDFSQWHTASVEWTPGKIVYLMDDKPWATITSHVPAQPMHLIMQTHVGSNGSSGDMPAASITGHVDLQIDWVHVYSLNR